MLAICDTLAEPSGFVAAGSEMETGEDEGNDSHEESPRGTKHVNVENSDDSDDDGPGALNPVDRKPAGLPTLASFDAPQLTDEVVNQIAGMVAAGGVAPKKEEQDPPGGHTAAGSSSASNVKKEDSSGDRKVAGDKRGSQGGDGDPPAKRPAIGHSSAPMQSGDFYLANLCYPTRKIGETKEQFTTRAFVARFRNGHVNTHIEANPLVNASLWGCPGKFPDSAPPPPLADHQSAIASEVQLRSMSGGREAAGHTQTWGEQTGLGKFNPWSKDHTSMQIICKAPEAFLDKEKHRDGVIIFDGSWMSNRDRTDLSKSITHHLRLVGVDINRHGIVKDQSVRMAPGGSVNVLDLTDAVSYSTRRQFLPKHVISVVSNGTYSRELDMDEMRFGFATLPHLLNEHHQPFDPEAVAQNICCCYGIFANRKHIEPTLDKRKPDLANPRTFNIRTFSSLKFAHPYRKVEAEEFNDSSGPFRCMGHLTDRKNRMAIWQYGLGNMFTAKLDRLIMFTCDENYMKNKMSIAHNKSDLWELCPDSVAFEIITGRLIVWHAPLSRYLIFQPVPMLNPGGHAAAGYGRGAKRAAREKVSIDVRRNIGHARATPEIRSHGLAEHVVLRMYSHRLNDGGVMCKRRLFNRCPRTVPPGVAICRAADGKHRPNPLLVPASSLAAAGPTTRSKLYPSPLLSKI